MQIAVDPAGLAIVMATTPVGTEYGVVVRQSGTAIVTTPYLQADQNDTTVFGDTVLTSPDRANTWVLTTPTVLAGTSQIVAANVRASGTPNVMGRRGLIIANTGTNDIYILYGSIAAGTPTNPGTASATNFTYHIPAGTTWDMPSPIYQGRINGYCSSSQTPNVWEAE